MTTTTTYTADQVREALDRLEHTEAQVGIDLYTAAVMTYRAVHCQGRRNVKPSSLVTDTRNDDTVARLIETGKVLALPGEVEVTKRDRSEAEMVRRIVNACANRKGVRLAGIREALDRQTDRAEAVAALQALLVTDETPMDKALSMLERAITQVGHAFPDDGILTPEQTARLIAAATDAMALAGRVATAAPVAV